jgi:hypothetical protein
MPDASPVSLHAVPDGWRSSSAGSLRRGRDGDHCLHGDGDGEGKATAYAYWPTPGSADVSAALGKPWSDMLTGKADPKTTLTQLKQAAQTVMDKYK